MLKALLLVISRAPQTSGSRRGPRAFEGTREWHFISAQLNTPLRSVFQKGGAFTAPRQTRDRQRSFPKTGRLMGLGQKSESDEFESKTHVVT